jgi:hypothetical protein
MITRRQLVAAGLAGAAGPAAAFSEDVAALLRTGGVVIAFRHALAPGSFDPPDFKLGDCSTQRNLSEPGRAQARLIGDWFKARALQPAQVRSSPWCRCMDTGVLAFGRAQPWAALGSPYGVTEGSSAASLAELRRALAVAAAQPGRFEVWLTHMFVLADLVATNTASGEGLVLRAQGGAAPQVLGRLLLAQG